jgi:hypothetical protein
LTLSDDSVHPNRIKQIVDIYEYILNGLHLKISIILFHKNSNTSNIWGALKKISNFKVMSLFTSDREKRLWLWSFSVLVAIYLSLVLGQQLTGILFSQDIAAVIFSLSMLLVGATIMVNGLRKQPSITEVTVLLGIAAVYLMFFLRIGITERSHLFEYSVLALFIYEALKERVLQGRRVPIPALTALLATILIGAIDEALQLFLPYRVFDPVDIMFNSIAALMAIGASMVLT